MRLHFRRCNRSATEDRQRGLLAEQVTSSGLENDELQAQLQDALVAQARLEQQVRDADQHHADQLQQLMSAKEALTNQFKALASDALNQNADAFGKQQMEMLRPFAERIQRFEQQVAQSYEKEGQARISLLGEIKRLAEQSDRMGREADALAKALKGEAKTRGDWGEVMLERLLEEAGLRRDHEFQVQASYSDATGGRFQPDVIVHLPDDQCIVVDSKVSLVSWLQLQEADSDEARSVAMEALRQSVRQHVKDLGGKNYQQLEGMRTVDFVLLFIPIEAAFATVLNNDLALYGDALIVILSSSAQQRYWPPCVPLR